MNGHGRGSRAVVAIAAVVVVIGSVSLWAVSTLRNQERVIEQRASDATQLLVDLQTVDGLSWRAMASDPRSVQSQLDRAMHHARHTVDELGPGLSARRRQLLDQGFAHYLHGVHQQLGALVRGDGAEARRLSTSTVEPAFATLVPLTRGIHEQAEEQEESKIAVVDKSTAILVMVALAAVGFAMLVVARRVRRSRERELEHAHQAHFRALVESSNDVISSVDAENQIRFFSPNWHTLFPHAAAKTDVVELLPPESRRAWSESVNDLRHTGKSVRYEFSLEVDGELRTVAALGTAMRDTESGDGQTAWIWSDITDQRSLEDQLAHQAFHDPLTGLANRALFQNRMDHALAASRRNHRPVALLLADLDTFKAVNDELGHTIGDELLEVVAARLLQCTRSGETVARLGGDEFAIVVEGDLGDARELAERILEYVPQEVRIDNSRLYPRLSIGITEATVGATVGEVLRQADTAMYDAKAAGRSRYAVYSEEVAGNTQRRLDLVADLETAIRTQQFVLHYQPTVTLPSGEIDGFEALVRWNHPTHGLVPPIDFLPVAEANGQIVPIGRWVMRQACADAALLARHLGQSLPMHVNVSVHQLRNLDFVDDVRACLAETRIEPASLVIEITESVLLDNRGAVDRLNELRALGVRIAVDDFGTGYTSINYLRTLPIDILKIDRSFVSGDAVPSRQREALLTGILGLARGLSLRSVAEGVETEEQRDQLTRLGCDEGQGFLFARPMPFADLLTATDAATVVQQH